jgi:hypothetical protein
MLLELSMQSFRVHLFVIALLAAPVFGQAVDFEPVHPDRLIEVLPQDVPDFTASAPTKTQAGEIGSRFALVSRVYTQAGGGGWFVDEEEKKPTVTIKITDTAPTDTFQQLHSKLASMGDSGKSGFSHAISIDNYLAVSNYREVDEFGLLSVSVADRFLVQIGVSGLSQQAMMDWWQKIDEKKLAALAIPPTPTPASTPTHTQTSSS